MKVLGRESGIFEKTPYFVMNAPMRNAAAFLPCLLCCLSVAAADLDTRRAAMVAELDTLPPLLASPQTCQRIGFHGLAADPAWVVIDLGRTVTPERVALFPARLPGAGARQSGFPAAFTVEISDDPSFAEKVEIAEWREREPGDGEQLPFWMAEGNGAAGRYLRIVVTGFRIGLGGDRFFRFGEVVVLAEGKNAALKCSVQSSASLDSARRWEPLNLTDGYFWCLPLRAAGGSATSGGRTQIDSSPIVGGTRWLEVDLGQPEPIDEIHLVPAHPAGLADLPGYGFPPQFQLLADSETAASQVLLNELEPVYPAEALPNPGAAQVMLATRGLVAQRVRLAAEALWRIGPGSLQSDREFVLALAELQCWRDGRNLAAGKPVTISDSAEGDGWSAAAVTDGFSSRHALLDWKTWLDGLAQRVELEAELATIDETLARRREDRLQQLLTVAVGSLVALALAGIAVILWLRAAAARRLAALQRQLARDLHDEIGASLSELAIQSDLARQQQARQLDTGPRLAEIAATARETLDHMRDVIWLLVPKAGTWGDLSHRLESVANRLLDGIDHEVLVTGDPPEGRPAPQWARDAVLFLKEAITNARRHGGAERIAVGIDWSDGLALTVADDGGGFDPEAVAAGHGLENLRERAAAMQARCEIESRVGEGTTVRLVALRPRNTNHR
jgi:signal transduction histidine kinase